MNNYNVTLFREGWFIPNKPETIMWEDYRLPERLCELYGQKPDDTGTFMVDALVHRPAGKGRIPGTFDQQPWLTLTPAGEHVENHVSLNCVYDVVDNYTGDSLGKMSLCWEGLIEAFHTGEAEVLEVYLSNYARVPRSQYAVEADYDN